MTKPDNTFVRGNEHLDRLLAAPELAAEVAQAHETAEEMDRAYAMNRGSNELCACTNVGAVSTDSTAARE